jgi:hypothetical protein
MTLALIVRPPEPVSSQASNEIPSRSDYRRARPCPSDILISSETKVILSSNDCNRVKAGPQQLIYRLTEPAPPQSTVIDSHFTVQDGMLKLRLKLKFEFELPARTIRKVKFAMLYDEVQKPNI